MGLFGGGKKKRGRPPKEAEAPNQGDAAASAKALAPKPAAALPVLVITPEEIHTLKTTIAYDLNDSEFKLFLFECSRRGVHPLSRLIHPVKRQGKVTFQSSIDYLRARAESSGRYNGQDAPVYAYKDPARGPVNGNILSATVTVYRKGIERGIAATAFFDEYKPAPPNDFMWNKMGHVMIAKCAEALALRKGFPEELQGLYAREEMGGGDAIGEIPQNNASKPALKEPQAKVPGAVDGEVVTHPKESTPAAAAQAGTPVAGPKGAEPAKQPPAAKKEVSDPKITLAQAGQLFRVLREAKKRTQEELHTYLNANYGIERSEDILANDYATIERWVKGENKPK